MVPMHCGCTLSTRRWFERNLYDSKSPGEGDCGQGSFAIVEQLQIFEGQVALLKKVENIDYVFDPKAESSNENVMDRWILASCQSLLVFVNEEMAAYRLYTVVPRLLSLIDNTTNWYIRFNRKRLKGELGIKDTQHALNTLSKFFIPSPAD
jgi:valyl-tRNA synthetase